MMLLQMYFGTILKVNLSSGEIEESEIDEDLIVEKIGGAPVISSLIDDAESDCIALGSGPLTGTPAPAASAAICCVKKNGNKRFAPVLLNGGLELRLVGFDFVIIEGASKATSYLWMRDRAADLVEMAKSDDAWETCSRIRSDQGDSRIQVISSSRGNFASLNFTSGWDGIGLGSMMRSMNLQAIAFRGMGDIEISNADIFLEKCSAMMRSAPTSLNGRAGIESILDKNEAAKIRNLERNRACFSCPFPCLTYADSGDQQYPQFLLMDQRSTSQLIKLPGSTDIMTKAISKMHRAGFNAAKGSIPVNATLDSIAEGNFSSSGDSDIGVNHLDTITNGISESDLIAAGYVLGLCPRYLGIFHPEIDEYCSLAGTGLGMDLSKEKLAKLGNALLRGQS